MRKFLVLILIAIFICQTCMAESQDLSSMPFDDLEALKKSVDTEYNSRPESEGITLTKGVYTVESVLKPGQYYVAMVEPDPDRPSCELRIYTSYEAYSQDEDSFEARSRYYEHIRLGDDPESIIFNKNEVICIKYGGSILIKSTPFNTSDYYKYEPPTGTTIPIGTFIIGEDIPANTYSIYPATNKGGEFQLYTGNKDTPKEGYKYIQHVDVLTTPEFETVELSNGDIIEVFKPIIFSQKPKLNFD